MSRAKTKSEKHSSLRSTTPPASNVPPSLGRQSALAFQVAEQRYALPIESIIHITCMVNIARLPKAPDLVMGVIDFRGKVTPVIDARARLELPSRPYTLRTPIIIAQLNGRAMGLAVDEVHGVLHLPREQVQAPDQIVTQGLALQVFHLLGVAPQDDGLLFILDPTTFLLPKERESLENALAGPTPPQT